MPPAPVVASQPNVRNGGPANGAADPPPDANPARSAACCAVSPGDEKPKPGGKFGISNSRDGSQRRSRCMAQYSVRHAGSGVVELTRVCSSAQSNIMAALASIGGNGGVDPPAAAPR